MTSPLLDSATLAALSDIAASGRVGITGDTSHTATIIAPSPTRANGAPTRGGQTETTVPCLFWTVSGDEASEDMLAQRGRYRMDISLDASINHNCTVLYQGIPYRVLWVPPAYEVGRIIGLTEA